MKKIDLLTRSRSNRIASVAFAAVLQAPLIHAGGISNFECGECVAMLYDVGADSSNCADTELPACEIPDWFPMDAYTWFGEIVQLDSTPQSATLRDNSVTFSSPDGASSSTYRRYEHQWFSKVGTPYGPALPSQGHVWNEYDVHGLIRSTECNRLGTWSSP